MRGPSCKGEMTGSGDTTLMRMMSNQFLLSILKNFILTFSQLLVLVLHITPF
jgi:hypothetical protein